MRRAGAYVLDVELGRGAAGTVWRAHRDGPVAQTVAVKRLRAGADPRDLERLRREATILTELDHPHIVRVLEVVADDNGEPGGGDEGIALVMQYAPGGSLDDLLSQRGRLDPGEVVAVAAPIADALASAHRRGVLHGDVKPANVVFTSDGEPLLSDFGVARSFGRPATVDHDVAGTAEYLAPERFDGADPDPRTDVYALGIVCYRALLGRLPYEGSTPLAVVRVAERGEHAALGAAPGVPPELAAAVESAIARDPTARTATAAELGRALRSAVAPASVRLPGVPAPDGVGAPPGTAAGAGAAPGSGTRTFGRRPPGPAGPTGPRRRRRWPVTAAVLAVAAAVGLLAGPLDPGDDDEGRAGEDCPALRRPEAGTDAQVVYGDADGDGCRTVGVYSNRTDLGPETGAMVLEIRIDDGALRPQRFDLGQRGDRLLLGDWDCDGIDTPALYRPTTGVTSYYDSWATEADGSDGVVAISEVPGVAGAEPTASDTDGDGCDEVVLVAPA